MFCNTGKLGSTSLNSATRDSQSDNADDKRKDGDSESKILYGKENCPSDFLLKLPKRFQQVLTSLDFFKEII